MAALPLVVIVHGRAHQWDWYNYLQHHLSSHGYVVVSVAVNTFGVNEIARNVIHHLDRLIDVLSETDCSSRVSNHISCGGTGGAHLCDLAGRIDPHEVVLIGHSRGGNGVVFAENRLNQSHPSHVVTERLNQNDIAALVSMAPTDRPDAGVLASPGEKPFLLLWSAGDADVSGVPTVDDQEKLAFQILDRAMGHRQSLYFQGGAHGWFHENCESTCEITGALPDCKCRGLDPSGSGWGEAGFQKVVKGQLIPFLKVYVEQNVAGQDFFWRPRERFHVPGTMNVRVAKEHRFGVDPSRFVIDDFESQFGLNTSSSGGAVTYVAKVAEDEMRDKDCHFDWDLPSFLQGTPYVPACTKPCDPCVCPSHYGEPSNSATPCNFVPECEFRAHEDTNGLTRSRAGGISRGAMMEWPPDTGSAPYFYEWSFAAAPPALTDDHYLSFRAAQMPRHPKTRAEPDDLDFRVTLRDSATVTASVCIKSYESGIIEPFGRTGPGAEEHEGGSLIYDCGCTGLLFCCRPRNCNPGLSDEGWQAEFETVRIRLGDFRRGGSALNLGNLAAVRFEFGTCTDATQGRIAVDDVEFTSAGLIHPPPPPCPAISVCEGTSCLEANEIDAIDTELHACQPASGPVLDCGASQTVHVVVNDCIKTACCFETPPCVCPSGDCEDAKQLDCR